MRKPTCVSDFVTVKITGADIPALLQCFAKSNIILYHIRPDDILSVIVLVHRSDLNNLTNITKLRGGELSVMKRKGIYWIWRSLLGRHVLIAGVVLIIFLSWFIPTRVLFVSVEGNESIPTNLVLEKAAACGIVFGADRREIRSEKTKNALLEALPELQWMGINTYGCTAVISVSEKAQKIEEQEKKSVSSIVALRDGIIRSYNVTNGNLLCKEGQAVKAGEILVSGYTDCGIKIQATRAQAEIFATTARQLTIISPLDYIEKGERYIIKTKYSLIFEKNRINLSKDSGISGPVCDKMYSQYYCVLPGGFRLPISVAVEKQCFRKADSIMETADISQTLTQEFAEEYLLQNMLSGSIVGKLESANVVDASYVLFGRYICLEIIGQERSEEIIKYHG